MKRDEVMKFPRPSNETKKRILPRIQSKDVPADYIKRKGSRVKFTVSVAQAERIFKERFHYVHNTGLGATIIRALGYSSREMHPYVQFIHLRAYLATLSPQKFLPKATFTVVSINGDLNEQDPSGARAGPRPDTQCAFYLIHDTLTTYYAPGRGRLAADADEPYPGQLLRVLNLLDKDLPAILTTSYGKDEQSVPKLYADIICSLLFQLAVRGVPAIFSSRSLGVERNCRINDGTYRIRLLPVTKAANGRLNSLTDKCLRLYNPQGRVFEPLQQFGPLIWSSWTTGFSLESTVRGLRAQPGCCRNKPADMSQRTCLRASSPS